MSLELWMSFVLAATIVLVIPGPTIILVVSQSVTHGRRSVFPLVTGVLLGDFTAMTLSLLGLGVVMTASATLFMMFKWAGALYLIYLGFKAWFSKPDLGTQSDEKPFISSGKLFKQSFLVTVLNPKPIAFFVAFFPQFVVSGQPAAPQFLVLGSTFLVLATLNAAVYAIFAGHLSDRIKREQVKKWFNRCSGGALIGAGLITLGLRRSS